MSNTIVHRIGLVAPSSVGKTTLVASVLLEGSTMLKGQFGRLVPEGQTQAADLSNLINLIQGSLQDQRFDQGAVPPSVGTKNYKLRLTAGLSGPSVVMDIMDYPGGFLTGETEAGGSWERVAEHIEQCTMLLVPINAPALMSADVGARRAALPSQLAIHQVSMLVDGWSSIRGQVGDTEPACIVFCPVRCESYLADHHNSVDRSAELRAAVMRHYGDIAATVRANAPNAEIGYLPIDTVGSVSLKEAPWQTIDGRFQCRPTFVARHPYKFDPKGVSSLFVLMAKLLMENQEEQAKDRVDTAETTFSRAKQEVERDRFIFARWFMELTGQMDELRARAASRRNALAAARSDLGALRTTMEFLRAQPLDRYQKWTEGMHP